MEKLTDRQKKFVNEYLIDLNGTQAAIRAGYSEKTANRIAAENLTKPDIRVLVDKRLADRARRTEITQDFVLQELMKIATADATDFATVQKRNRVKLTPTEDLPPEKRAAIAGIKTGKFGVEIKAYDKIKALELIGRHLGMFAGKDNDPDSGVEIIDDV